MTAIENALDDEKGILYEFITLEEWPQEPELLIRNEALTYKGKRSSTFLNSIWSKIPTFRGCLSPKIIYLKNNRLPWQLAAADENEDRLIAILQDNVFETRSSKDDYSTIIGSNTVKRDLYPQWRKIAWSSDAHFLAVGYSDGSVDCFDSGGVRLFTIQANETTNDLSDALVEVIFMDSRVQSKSKWKYELVLINYKGQLRSYFISQMGYEFHHAFNFKQTVTAIVYHPKFNVIFCCGGANELYASTKGDEWNAGMCGISTWRLLKDMPYYRQSTTVEQEMNIDVKTNYFQQIRSRVFGRMNFKDEIYKVALSPNGEFLVSSHVSGTICIWNVPSMRLFKKWTMDQQPECIRETPSFGMNKKSKFSDSIILPKQVIELQWWSNKALIIGRCNGAVSVSSVSHDLKNLLGGSYEWFESQPQLTGAFDNRFLVLECDFHVISRKSPANTSISENDSFEKIDDSSDEEIESSSNIFKSALFYVTDIESFRPLKRKPKLTSKIFRLICLKSTTPEELFLSKLDDEQFGEALSLAKTYDLDCDLVYQRQWRSSEYSLIAIQDYLTKITKRFWVLQECLERVPEDIDSARALLQFGLQGTDIDVLVNIGTDKDDGKIVLNLNDDEDDLGSDELSEEELLEQKRLKIRNQYFDQVDFSKLTIEQKHVCLCRIKLLQYLDRLNTYEVMLGGPVYSAESYDAKFFSAFRCQSAIEATVEFAHHSNWQGVSAMFTYHGKQTLRHRLAILSNFPETTSPFIYRSLLPEIGIDGTDYFVYHWEEENIRNCDWVESASCLEALGLKINDTASSILYEENSNLEKYVDFENNPELLTKWYIERTFEIEANSSLVTLAIELIRLGMERNVQNLELVHNDLLTLEVLVYECLNEEFITLKQLQSLKDSEKLNLLLRNSTNENIVKNVKLWAIPFLSRCENQVTGSANELLRNYMIELSAERLDSCAVLFRSAPHQQHYLTRSTAEFISLALDCIYNCKDDQLESAIEIFECFPHRGFGLLSKELEELHDRISLLEKHIGAAKVLKKYNVPKSIAYINNCQGNEQEIKNLLTMLTRISCRRESTMKESELKELLETILKLQQSVFRCIDISQCLEIFAVSLLSSGRNDYIQLSCSLFQCKTFGQRTRPSFSLSSLLPQTIPKDRSTHLIISAAREYFNSASEMNDPVMDLARQTLRMITDPDEETQAELDLIESLKLLSYFEVKMLPMQIRMCENRLDLIKSVFDIKPSAYQETQKLMTLAHYLRVGQDVKQWEEQVLILIAKAALKANDFVPCYNACTQLASHKYSEGWEVCYQLGDCDLFEDIESRCDLLTFAAVYCPNDKLEGILKIKFLLNEHLVKQKLLYQFDASLKSESNDQVSSGSFASQIHYITTTTTKQAFSKISETKFIKDASSWMSSLWQAQSSLEVDEIAGFNMLFTKLSVPTFNSTCIPDSLESPLYTTYRSYAMPTKVKSISTNFNLISVVMSSWNLNDGGQLTLSSQLIQQITKCLLPLDSILGLACLLTIQDPTAIDECLKTLPTSDVWVQLALYTFSLRICQIAGLISKAKLFAMDSDTLFKRAERYARLHHESEKNLTLKHCCEYLNYYVKKREDFDQGKVLLSIGRGVDVTRFCSDEQYRYETVLGLVMTTDDKIFNIAITLGNRYQMNMWELYMTHLEYLFNEEDLKLSALEKRVAKLELLPKLLENVKKFKERLESRVYATISGVDHNRLYYFYTLLQQCNSNSENDRLTLLKKLRPLAKGLDFIQFVNIKNDALSILKPVLTSGNVVKIAKLAPTISKCCQREITSSNIYQTFILKCFFEGQPDSEQAKSSSEDQNWIGRYNFCKTYFEFLTPQDFMRFLDDSLFGELSFEIIPQDIRIEILERSQKFAKQEVNRCKDDLSRLAWLETINFICQAKDYLSWLQSDEITKNIIDADVKLQEFFRKLRQAHSQEKLKTLLLEYVMNGYSDEELQRLLSFCPPSCTLQIEELVSEAFSIGVSFLTGEESRYHHLLVNRDPIDLLGNMISAISCSQKEIVPSSMIMNELEAVYTNEAVESSVRLKLIDLVEKFGSKNADKLQEICIYKMKMMIAQTWIDYQIPEDFSKSEIMERTYNELLERSQTLEQGKCLMWILSTWQKLNESASSASWFDLMRFFMNNTATDKLDCVIDCLRFMQHTQCVELKELEPIFTELERHNSVTHLLKFCLLTTHEKLYTQVFNYLKNDYEGSKLNLDEETCQLLIERDLVPQTVPTVLFEPLMNYILKQKDYEFVKNIATILQKNGYLIEAASIMTKKTTFPKGLQTFSSALGLFQHR